MKLLNNVYKFLVGLTLLLLFYSYASNPPLGYTGAPSEDDCGSCHGGASSSLTGTIAITGLPSQATPGTSYPITVTITKNGTASKAGFEIVPLFDATSGQAGSWTIGAGLNQSTTGGRTYVRQSSAPNFSGNTVTWNFNWVAPSGSNGAAITLYTSGIIANGNGSTGGDRVVTATATTSLLVISPVSVTMSKTNVSCFGGSDGTATANPSGGTTPYTFIWSNGKTTQTITNLTAGTYSVTVKDANNQSAGGNIAITQPTALSLSVSNIIHINCATPQGSATITASGGTPGYTYSWPDGTTTSTNNQLTVGTHIVTVTDNVGCVNTRSIAITANTTPPSLMASTADTISCKKTTAQLKANATPSATAAYKWAGPGISGSNQTQQNPFVAVAGVYTVTVTNTANSCTASQTVTVESNYNKPSLSVVGDTITCKDTLATLSANSANGNTYLWSGSGIDSTNRTLKQPKVKKTGWYIVTVTDANNGCTKKDSTWVPKDSIAPVVSTTTETLSCADTLATITLSSNVDSVTYLWTGPGINNNNSTVKNPDVTLSGDYIVKVTNKFNGCISSDTATVSQDITPPTISGNATTITCINQTSQLTAQSNASNASYLWSGPGINSNNQNQQNPVVLLSGSYSVSVTNAQNGCTNSTLVNVAENKTAPIATATGGVLTCSQNSTMLTGSSNKSSVTYNWSGPNGFSSTLQNPSVTNVGNYILAVTDTTNGCVGLDTAIVSSDSNVPTLSLNSPNLNCVSNNATIAASTNATNPTYQWSGPNGFSGNTSMVTVSLAGDYTVTVTSSNGCKVIGTTTVGNPTLPTPNIVGPTSYCKGGVITIALDKTYSNYSWSNGNSSPFIIVSAEGTYSVTVTDQNGCKNSTSVSISEVDLTPPTISGKLIICPGGLTTLSSSSNPNYTSYLWSNGENNPSITVTSAGKYSVLVKDVNGCEKSAEVTVNQDNSLSDVFVNTDTLTCRKPSLNLKANNTNTVTSYEWSGPNNFSSTATSPTINKSGMYSVTVENNNGCIKEAETFISEDFAQPLVTVSGISSLTCKDSVSILTASSNISSSYSWTGTNGQPLGNDNPLRVTQAGIYIVEATADRNGCKNVFTTEVKDARNLKADLSILSAPKCWYDQPVVSASLNVTGGTTPYSILWSNGSTVPNPNNLGLTFSYEVKDAGGCVVTNASTITMPPPIAYTATITDAKNGINNGSIQLNTTGGTGALSYTWQLKGATVGTTKDLTNIGDGSYVCFIKDANNCTLKTDTLIVKMKVGIDIISSGKVQVYPNPAITTAVLEWTGDIPTTYQLEILDWSGRLIQRVGTVTDGQQKVLLPIESLVSGKYWVKVSFDNKWIVKELLIQK